MLQLAAPTNIWLALVEAPAIHIVPLATIPALAALALALTNARLAKQAPTCKDLPASMIAVVETMVIRLSMFARLVTNLVVSAVALVLRHVPRAMHRSS